MVAEASSAVNYSSKQQFNRCQFMQDIKSPQNKPATRYTLYVDGSVKNDLSPEQVKADLKSGFNISDEKLNILLSGKKVVVLRDSDANKALATINSFQSKGLKVFVENNSPLDDNVKVPGSNQSVQSEICSQQQKSNSAQLDENSKDIIFAHIKASSLTKVEEYQSVESGICERKAFWMTLALSTGSTIISISLALGIVSLIGFDFVPLTIALLVIGPPAGALAGNYLNFSCRHSKKRQLALALGFAIQICVGLFLIAISFDGAFKPFKLLEGIVMLASPLIAKQMLKSWFHYCEQCKKPMEEVKYKYGVNASPGRLISGLNSSILINEDEAKHTREDEVFHGQKYIEVAMYKCSHCNDAIVTLKANYTPSLTGNSESLVFFSDFVDNLKDRMLRKSA